MPRPTEKSSWGGRQGHPFLSEPNETGPEVVVTVDTEDTGERRQMGSFDARRVRTSITVEPSKGAAAKPGTVEIDGWYIDLFGWTAARGIGRAWESR